MVCSAITASAILLWKKRMKIRDFAIFSGPKIG